MRKTIRTWALLLVVLALVAAACGSSDDSDDATGATTDTTTEEPAAEEPAAEEPAAEEPAAEEPAAADAIETLKIGVLLPLTGFVAGPGEDAQQGLELYFNQFGDGNTVEVGGVSIEFILEDTGSDPAVALTSATKLVEVDDVDIIIPGILASTGGAVGDALGERDDVLLLSPYSCNDDFTQRGATAMPTHAPAVGHAANRRTHSACGRSRRPVTKPSRQPAPTTHSAMSTAGDSPTRSPLLVAPSPIRSGSRHPTRTSEPTCDPAERASMPTRS